MCGLRPSGVQQIALPCLCPWLHVNTLAAGCREACARPAQRWNTGEVPPTNLLSLAACHDLGNSAVIEFSLDSTPRKGKLPPAAALGEG